jgi:hypothetical protein
MNLKQTSKRSSKAFVKNEMRSNTVDDDHDIGVTMTSNGTHEPLQQTKHIAVN